MGRRKSAAQDLRRGTAEAPEPGGLAVGPAVRERRRRLGLTLQAVAEKAGVSAPFISQVERSLAEPSITSLMGIARALGVDITYFISVPRVGQIVRRHDSPELIDLGANVEYRRLSGAHEERRMEALLITVPKGSQTPQTRREGEGFWYVLSGELQVVLGEEAFRLRTGDSAHFDQRHTYSMSNLSDSNVTILWVGTPALF